MFVCYFHYALIYWKTMIFTSAWYWKRKWNMAICLCALWMYMYSPRREREREKVSRNRLESGWLLVLSVYTPRNRNALVQQNVQQQHPNENNNTHKNANNWSWIRSMLVGFNTPMQHFKLDIDLCQLFLVANLSLGNEQAEKNDTTTKCSECLPCNKTHIKAWN